MTDERGDEAAQQDRDRRSYAELEAGRLPLRAQERLAAMEADHAFTSDLTTAEHHAIRSVGFVPVGQVMGLSVYQIGYTGGWDCGVRQVWGMGGYGVGGGMLGGGMRGGGMRGGGFYNSGGFSGGGMSGGGGFAGGGSAAGGIAGGGMGGGWGGGGWGGTARDLPTVDVTPWRRALLEAQQRAVGRMEQEARALGADGVVAVRFSESRVANNGVEFLAIGTAVRSAGPTRPGGRLFSCDLTGQDFAQLVLAGYLPTSLLFGVAVMTRHDDWATRSNSNSWSNVELAGYTQLTLDTRSQARLALARSAAQGGATFAVLAQHVDRISEHECQLVEGGRDHVMRTTFVGTGVVEVGRPAEADLPDALPIMRLRDRRTTVTETSR